MNADRHRWIPWLLLLVVAVGNLAAGQGRTQGQRPSERVAEIVRLKQHVTQHPDDAAARVELGNLLDDSGDSAGAVAQYREAIRVNPNFARAYRNLALAHLRQGQWAAAESAARDAVRLEPKYVQGRCDLAAALGSQRKEEEAAREWRQAIETDRGEVSRYWGFERIQAEELARAAPEAAARFLVGMTLERVGERGRAVREIELAVEVDSKFALGYLELAQLYRDSGREKDRAVAYTKATGLNPGLEQIYKKNESEGPSETRRPTAGAASDPLAQYREMIPNLVRYSHWSSGQAAQVTKARALLQEAAVRLKRLLGEMLESAEGYVLLGDALRELDETRAAVGAYETAIRAARGGQAAYAGRAWMGLGLLHARARRETAAMEMFAQGMLATPGDPELLSAAASLAATSEDPQARNPAKALEWAKKAVELTKEKDAACWSALAEAHFANGQLEAAVHAIQKAISLEPKENTYRDQFEKYERAAVGKKKK